MHFINQKLSFDTVRNLQNIFMEHDLKRKIDNFDLHNVFLAIATNIYVLHKNGFVVQGHI